MMQKMHRFEAALSKTGDRLSMPELHESAFLEEPTSLEPPDPNANSKSNSGGISPDSTIPTRSLCLMATRRRGKGSWTRNAVQPRYQLPACQKSRNRRPCAQADRPHARQILFRVVSSCCTTQSRYLTSTSKDSTIFARVHLRWTGEVAPKISGDVGVDHGGSSKSPISSSWPRHATSTQGDQFFQWMDNVGDFDILSSQSSVAGLGPLTLVRRRRNMVMYIHVCNN